MTSRTTINKPLARHISLPILLSLGLVACNSGGSSNQPTADANLLSGKITGVNIEGLSYQTESQSGKTTADSTFTYKQGELVNFYIGDISLGQSTAAAEISLFDLMGISEPEAITRGIHTKLKATAQQSKRNPNVYQFERLSNLIVFLTAIDEDGTFSNGVTVPAQLETVAQDKTIDIIGTQITAFESQLEDSNLLTEGVTEGLWPSKPSIVSPGVALDAFYDSIGVTPEIYTASKHLIDLNNDGIFDGANDAAVNYTFDDAGNLTTLHKMIIGDETQSELTRYRYDDNGNLTGTYIDFDDDGAVDVQLEWAYDDKGQETLKQTDANGDGIFEDRATKEFTYHSNGSLASQKETQAQYAESTGDLQSSYSETTQHDSEGRQTYYEESYQDIVNGYSGGNSTRYSYDLAGNTTRTEEDHDLDGVADTIHRYEFDEDNKRTLTESDYDADGTADYVETYTHDSAIKQTTVNIDGIPDSADGIIDLVAVIRYDSHDNQISEQVDQNNDGSYEQETTWDYSYDAEGRILSRDHVSTTSPEENHLTTYRYDSEGRTISYQRVGDSERYPNFLYTYTYVDDRPASYSAVFDDRSTTTVFHDEFGGQTVTEYDSEGVVTSIDSILFDERGNYLGTSYAEDDSGIAKNEIKMTYNDDDLLLSERRFVDGEERFSTEYSYDEQGELISTVTADYQYEADNRYTTETYEYTNIKSWKALFYRYYREWSNPS